jgi:hypothetical protein
MRVLACIRLDFAFDSLVRKPIVAKDFLSWEGEIQSKPAWNLLPQVPIEITIRQRTHLNTIF